ncbi:hypothetical protein B0T11DRAFT_116102 [Plectosphaerella cucumerina]|uniref:SNF-domain-containing protein n=1 Tax=Plectosphaerella cucumerina TaxID=40658 RepID=A0A8K0T955_9PEZI|nr:hypothetical protein B0T11DRAFT_116102 [Plectosphaerella cucumerina]
MDTVWRGLKAAGRMFAPPPPKSDDGRDQWPSRAAFLLASMGGCAGMGNLLRYPSQVYNNYGLQWFVPYLMTVVLIAIPVLVLEIAIGQAYRGGSVIAYNNINQRLKGTGLSLIYIGFIVGPYFAVNLAWIMSYFRYSFQSPLPWAGRGSEFFNEVVVANPPPIEPGEEGNAWRQYPHVGMIGETTGWMVFTWFLIWLCIFRGVGLTGRVVYFTMGLPIAMTIVLVVRSLTLENAGEGVKYFWATWRGEELAKGSVWQTACGQVFFSTGVGFGYFTSYASYNRKHSNAVVDAIAIVSSNVAFENIAAFAVYGVIGFMRDFPYPGREQIGGFAIGFHTLPLAIVEMPGANFWAVALFFTLMTLGFSSGFAMLDAVVTMVMDSGIRFSRPIVVTALSVLSLLLALPYCTEFGNSLLNAIDLWTNNVALIFVVWAECVTSTTVYRMKDVTGQVGKIAFWLYQFAFFGGQIIGVAVAHGVTAGAGAGVGFGVYFAFTIAALIIGKTPDVTPHYFGSNAYTAKLWYLAFYSGEQLRRDLNVIVGCGKNWNIPFFWGILIKYISAPVLAMVFSFSYTGFDEYMKDPLHILGFFVGHCVIIIIGGSFIVPRWYNALIPAHRQNEGKIPYGPCVTQGTLDAELADAAEVGNGTTTSQDLEEKDSTPNSEQLVSGETIRDGDKEAEIPRDEPLVRER